MKEKHVQLETKHKYLDARLNQQILKFNKPYLQGQTMKQTNDGAKKVFLQ